MTHYMFSVVITDDVYDIPAEEAQESFDATGVFNEELKAAGKWVFGGGLERPSSATTISAHEGETIITDGPYAESKELLGGFWVVKAADLDEALKWAEKASKACGAKVEVRPMDLA